MAFWTCAAFYVEARITPEAPLRFLNGRLGDPSWLCLGVGFASVTIGIRHTNRHTTITKGLPDERPNVDEAVDF